MRIRKARKEDIEKIWEIEKESRKQHTKITKIKYRRLNKSKIDEKSKSEFIKDLSGTIGNKSNIFLVAEIYCEIVGWIFSELGTWWGCKDKSLNTIWIEDIGVLEKHKGKRIAERLLKETEKKARENEMKYGCLTVRVKNRPAYDLHKKNGYEDFAIEMVKKF